MAENTNIAWTDNSWNPWQGCRKVSPGCQNCYMYRNKKRYGQDASKVVRSAKATFNKPYTWKEPKKVFVCSWSDFFIEEADEWRDDAWKIIKENPHLTFQILTKRPENIATRLPEGWPLENVWLGVTAENEEMAFERIYHLLQIPCLCRFVSVEPMLGPIDLVTVIGSLMLDLGMLYSDDQGIHWVICGGESGPNARYMDPLDALEIKEQAKSANVPFFMKQMSGNTKKQLEDIPEWLQGREFP